MIQKPGNSTIINVCVIPSQEVGERCIALSQSLESEHTLFTLGGDKFAHMTVYMARFADEAIQQVVEGVEEALKMAKPFVCEHAGYYKTPGNYLEVSYAKTIPFLQLHEAIINKVAQYRINPGKPYKEDYFTPYTTEQQANAKETGYDLAHELYRPHVTLTRYRPNSFPDVFPGFPPLSLSFMLDRVCVYKADDNGVVYKRIQEFQVSQ